jgi:hypothetical protein
MRSLVPVVLAVAVVGCGAHRASFASVCAGPASAIERAAERGGPLTGGTRLSDCIADARSDADVQDVAAVDAAVADDLARRAPHDPRAARGLGFLIGAARRGAARNAGAAELANRLGADARRVHETAPAMDGAVARGSAAGQARG